MDEGFLQVLAPIRIHLWCQMRDLRRVPGIFEDDHVVGVEADGTAFRPLFEQILHDVHHRLVTVVALFRKERGDFLLVDDTHRVVQYEEIFLSRVERVHVWQALLEFDESL